MTTPSGSLDEDDIDAEAGRLWQALIDLQRKLVEGGATSDDAWSFMANCILPGGMWTAPQKTAHEATERVRSLFKKHCSECGQVVPKVAQ